MFAYLKGTITFFARDYVVIDVRDVGYKVFTANPYEFQLQEQTTLYTHQVVSENDISLYGFKTQEALDVFIKLISARGIGPKTACAILATNDINGLVQAIESENAKYLCKFPKIGPKTAQQIILDLKGKLALTNTPLFANNELNEALEALMALGYSEKELQKVKKELGEDYSSVDELIKKGLQLLLKQK